MNVRLWIWIGGLVTLQAAAVAQSRVPGNDISRIKLQADLYFKEAAYSKAIRLYQLCAAYLNPNIGDKKDLQSQIQKSQRLIQLDNLLLAEVRKSNYPKAIAYSEEMLRLNPNDPYVKVTRNDLKSSTNQQFNTQDVRLLSRVDVLIKQGNWSAALAILRLVDQLPNGRKNSQVAAKLDMVSQLEKAERAIESAIRSRDMIRVEQIASRIREKYPIEVANSSMIAGLPKLDEKYIIARRQLFQEVDRQIARCNYDRATQLLIEAKAKPGFAADPQLLVRVSTIRAIERQLENIINWKTDPNKRSITIQAYKSVYANKDFRNCIRENYYDYLTDEGRMKQSGSNYFGAIIAYKTAAAVSPALARRDRVAEKISICDSLSKCPDKDRTFAALMRTADQLYQECNCDSAMLVWQSAKPYLSSLCSSGNSNQAIWTDWSSKVSDCQKERTETSRYLSLLSSAETMFRDSRCQQSRQLLVNATVIKVRCGSLNRKQVDVLLAACDVCIKQQCYDSLITAAERSRGLGFDIDALKYYRQAKECVAKDNEQALDHAINELTCKIEGKGCPTSPVVKVDSQLSTVRSVLFDAILSGGLTAAKSRDESTRLLGRSTNYLKFCTGLKYLPKQSFISIGAGVQLERYHVDATNTPILAGGKVTIVNTGIYSFLQLHTPNYRSGRWVPYLSGTYTVSIPVLFNFQRGSYGVISTDKKFVTNSFSSANTGVGLEKIKGNRSYKIELTYQNVAGEVFRNQPMKGYDISLRGVNTLMINVGIGFR